MLRNLSIEKELIYAASIGDLRAVRELLTNGTAIDYQDPLGTALMYAARDGHLEIVRELLARGATIDFQRKGGQTALTLAAQSGNLETVRELLAHGAAVNHQDLRGCTPLHEAALMGHLEVVLELLAYGAATDLQSNPSGFTPQMYAAHDDHIEIIERLKEHEKEQQTYQERKNKIDAFFTFFSAKKEHNDENRPEAFMPNVVVSIIDDYIRPASIPVQTRKKI